MGWVTLALLASHFSMIGFPVDMSDADATGAALVAYAETCQPSPLKDKHHLCVIRDQTGAELVFGLDKGAADGMTLVTVNPALAGEGRAEVVVSGDVSDPDWRPFEVRVQVRMGPDEVPFVIDLADPREAARFSRDAKLAVDLTAFADEISIHDSAAAYIASQADREIKFAENHFIPTGMFAAGDEAEGKGKGKGKARPTAHAQFGGRILKSELRQNGVGKAGYWWMLVETYGGATVNVVADPEMVGAPPKAGGHVEGQFWISGRLARR